MRKLSWLVLLLSVSLTPWTSWGVPAVPPEPYSPPSPNQNGSISAPGPNPYTHDALIFDPGVASPDSLMGHKFEQMNGDLVRNFLIPAVAGGLPGLVKCVPKVAEAGGVRLSQKGLNLVGDHLAQFGDDAANAGMMQRLQDAFAAGQKVTGADANFYLHEASEATFMQQGIGYEAAHAAALEKYGVSPFSLYAPEVIQANPTLFNNAWKAATVLPPQP